MKNKVIFIMGVSGCGKTTIGKLLSNEMKIPFFDGDDYHSKKNITKMSSGKSLNDEDRFGWLKTLNVLAKKELKTNSCIIVCSALKECYRSILEQGVQDNSEWIFLEGSFQQITDRINKRKDHFMSSTLLQSQFDILEEPKDAIKINISLTPISIIEVIKEVLTSKSEFGLFGLGVMGKSLSRNLANKGFKISIFNRHVDGVEENVAVNFKNEFEELSEALPFDSIESFVNSLQTPRRIMLMVNAGKTTDTVVKSLLPFLSKGDILIDGGNSNYLKTKERFDYLKSKNIHFIGAGVSGGEEGALKGPSIMPSGNMEAYKRVQPFLEAIAAKDKNNLPCCTYIGTEGSGHFVKMVHNGIEYVEMQLLAEVCNILEALGQNPDEIANTLDTWKSSANSYLLEITIDILRKKEGDDWLVRKILDRAGNKGTGNWTTIASAALGVPSTLISSAVFSRYISFCKEERTELNKSYKSANHIVLNLNSKDVLEAYQFSRMINHYQGFKLLAEASHSFSWELNLSEIARIWTSGCIIKSSLMQDLVGVLKKTNNILTNKQLINLIKQYHPSTKKVLLQSVLNDIPTPCLSESVQFFNAITTVNSSANIIQAQRD